ncbi:MAG: glycosyl transferase family 2 [Alteromonas sp.]|nr:glycosyl transferase family 2 [Alteromonas sp.]MAY21637.1 glycosyl transferase family 2 [Flavobacteriaceae bacterium]|tara:strand:+ start:35765 stop:36457 length:693 start_codon:yes stop_codon:yes gene_type:complete
MISVVIPVLNEAENIPKLLTHLSQNAIGKLLAEIIVVDGGSTDNTVPLIKNHSSPFPIKVLESAKGRAKQMNLGAKNAQGNILYFLHADSFPPKGFDTLIAKEIAKGNPAGCFRMQFDSSHWWLKLVSWFTRFSWRACRGGDQSLFITKPLFQEIGGYDESYIIYEDNILLNEIYQRTSFAVIQEKIKSSARLYERKGVWKVQFHFLIIYFKKWRGASPKELFNYYKKYL